MSGKRPSSPLSFVDEVVAVGCFDRNESADGPNFVEVLLLGLVKVKA